MTALCPQSRRRVDIGTDHCRAVCPECGRKVIVHAGRVSEHRLPGRHR